VYEFTAYYRATSMGGRDEAWVFRLEGGELVRMEPAITERSRSGSHGYDIYRLEPGVYIVIDISRPNNRAKTYTVTVKELQVSPSLQATWRVLFTEEVEDLGMDMVLERVRGVVAHGSA
jgi:hypothetical protein